MSVPASVLPTTIAALPLVRPGTFVELVGVVVSERIGFVFLDFILDDSTGRIPVRYAFQQPACRNLPETLEQYVRVVGRVLDTPFRHVSTESVFLVESANEISYHTIAAAHAYLHFTQ